MTTVSDERMEEIRRQLEEEYAAFDDSVLVDVDRLEADGWEYVGGVGVDAGLVMIGDPCYVSVDDRDPDEHPVHNWGAFCDSLGHDYPIAKSLNYNLGHEGLGVVVSSGIGDGFYPVLVKKAVLPGWGERITAAIILFEYNGYEENEDGDEN